MKVNFSEIVISFIVRLASRIETARELLVYLSFSNYLWLFIKSFKLDAIITTINLETENHLECTRALKALIICLLVNMLEMKYFENMFLHGYN